MEPLKSIIFLADQSLVETLQWQRPFALISLGGNTIIGHLLNLYADLLGNEITIVAPDADGTTAVWLTERYPDLSIALVDSWEALGRLDGEILFINGRSLAKPNLPANPAPIAAITDENGAAAALSLQNGHRFSTPPAPRFQNWIAELESEGTAVTGYPAHFSFPVTTISELQYANKRLLGLGHGSEDLVDRSYAEEFMGLPPVFLHETAVVNQSVVGPYAHIGANAYVKNSIIRNSVISADAQIEDCILDGAVIGEGAKIIGKGKALFAGEHVTINL